MHATAREGSLWPSAPQNRNDYGNQDPNYSDPSGQLGPAQRIFLELDDLFRSLSLLLK
jgi:hypothetical protein